MVYPKGHQKDHGGRTQFFAEVTQIKRSGTVQKDHTFTDDANPFKGVFTNSFTVKEASSTSPQSFFLHLSNSQPKRKKKERI
jgi:hypothetical protein